VVWRSDGAAAPVRRDQVDVGRPVLGADAAIVGSECVARVAAAQAAGRDVVEDFKGLLVELGHVPDSATANPVH